MKSSGHFGIAISPHSAHVGSFQLACVTGDLQHLKGGVASEIRVPGLVASVTNVFIPARGFSLAGHLEVFRAHAVAQMVCAHRKLGPAINAASEIHQPRAVGGEDTYRFESSLFMLQWG